MLGASPSPVVGRLAPSPTGGLHLGHARTFLAAWLAARSAGGRVVLRIEDIDAGRVQPGATSAAIADLEWLGLGWDGEPYVQSKRTAAYKSALERLRDMDAVYPCVCSRSDVAAAASAPHGLEGSPVYPGTCAGRSARDVPTDRPFAWRFRVWSSAIGWGDLVRGPIRQGPDAIGGDFVVAREPFAPSYQLAVVVDDDAMGISQVIRGDDLIPSTPRQILLNQTLGGRNWAFGHLPIVVGPDGRRLAKRDGSIKLGTLREAGLDPRWIVGWVARSLGLSETIEPSTPGDWLGRLDLAGVPREAARFDPSELPI